VSTNATYLDLLRALINMGSTASPRGQETLEMLRNSVTIDMRIPIITTPSRELDYQFMAAEAYWILSGERRLNHPALVRNLNKYSDDGETMRGAYGPPFLQQVEYIVDILQHDPRSRQAVMTLWERSPRMSNDIPCTVSLQWLLRYGQIHCNVFMRSSDAWLGFPYDIFTFTMMTHYIRSCLDAKHRVGLLGLFVGSQHLYTSKQDKARAILDDVGGDILVIDTLKLIHPGDVMNALDRLRHIPECGVDDMKQHLCL
jgi:thymidylate synthase